eukprot:GDKI01001862.1.p1 GENE.GDKI01001862.1~~GDKI01001862.1.p1  ORF type:complete len:115 (+),score=39.80 GDKI01001862.1:50-394(+)
MRKAVSWAILALIFSSFLLAVAHASMEDDVDSLRELESTDPAAAATGLGAPAASVKGFQIISGPAYFKLSPAGMSGILVAILLAFIACVGTCCLGAIDVPTQYEDAKLAMNKEY